MARPSAARPYDWEAGTRARAGRVVDLPTSAWDSTFDADHALALEPDVARRLQRDRGSVSVPPMAWSDAPGLATPSVSRDPARARARRVRRVAALIVLASLSLVTLVVTAFGGGEAPVAKPLGPAPAKRLLPSGPPRPQVVAMHDTLRVLLPIAQSRVTAIGYHGAGAGALPLEPVGTQANAGVLGRLVRRISAQQVTGVRYYLLEAGVGPQTGGLDVGARVGTDVYAPVDGTVVAISDYVVNGSRYGVRIDVQPSGNPGVVVSVDHLRPDPALTVGSTVSAARTKIGRVADLSRVERAALARYTHDKGYHVHLDVHAAASLAR